jgi:hypothetical protein
MLGDALQDVDEVVIRINLVQAARNESHVHATWGAARAFWHVCLCPR